jgi:hypothetical protein
MNHMTRLWALGALAFAGTAFGATEMEERARITDEVQRALFEGKWPTLEKTCNDYRTTKKRTSSGLWYLTLLHGSIDDAISSALERNDPDAAYLDLDARMVGWLKAYPRSPCAHLAVSIVHVAHAWTIRGGGYASQVAPENWAPFRKYIALARKNLEDHKSVAAVDPGWYECMLGIARAQGWPQADFDKLLNEALDKEPLFYQTYFAALENLLPKWHGDATQIETFARDAVRRTSKSEGLSMYARIYWYASQTQFENDLFTDSLAAWPLMKAGFDDVIARYPDAWNLNNYAKFACLAKDRKTARLLLGKIESEVVWEAWSPSSQLSRCRKWASAESL